MPIDLSSQKTEIAFALLAAAVVSGWRIYKGRAVDLDILMGAFEAFFGGALLPVSGVLIAYPFFRRPPDLSHYMFYIPFAGIGLLFMAFTGLRKALRVSGAPPGTQQPSP
jgi:hypothetical protein